MTRTGKLGRLGTLLAGMWPSVIISCDPSVEGIYVWGDVCCDDVVVVVDDWDDDGFFFDFWWDD